YRVFVAPTRYAAGTPYKVYEAAAHGLPIAATALLATQLGWRDGVELRVGSNAKEFARAMLALYHSKTEWKKIREGALARIRHEHNTSAYRKRIRDILEKLQPSAARK
ncbi:MAG: glycosyltransferase, partial [Acetobacteraceae bacterium]|nr:glycosyltransferase [Acetobacteraceae bacterium]